MSQAMTPERWERIQERFHQVLEAPAPGRADLLRRIAEEDPELADEVRSLLDAEAHGLLGEDRKTPLNGLVAEYVGPFRLIRRLGEGGMGTVYLAEREEAGFSQRVALKLLRAGFLDPRLADHVAHERRVLARLEHPNIARLIDGGSTPSGQPYLAMEYVEGGTLLEHARRARLTLADRVRLMVEVCEAVHYAHQQLVVHRDLKPSNVMVGRDGRPRLLDFGVSKLLDPEERTAGVTRSTPWITPAYASPEQFRGGAVTTLSDVYALGIILYELLSGERPYVLDGRTPAEMEQLICEAEPARPSDRCRDARCARLLRGDLDIIVLKAIAKQPARRYASAEQLAEDLRRYLDGRPVLAQPDSLGYRTGKFIRRHRTAAAIAAVTLVVTVAGVAMVGRQAEIARRERDRAEAARQQAEQVTAYVIGLFEAADSGQAAVDTTVARALLRQGVAQAEALTGQPVVQASMFDALGMVFVRLQRFDQATGLLERAWRLRTEHLPAGHPDLAESESHLGRVRRAGSRYQEALEHYQRALDIRLKAFGSRHALVAASYRDLGFLMPYLGRNQESVDYYRQALAIDRELAGEDHPQTADDLMLVGLALRRLDQAAEGMVLLEEALAIKQRLLGPDDVVTARARFHVADQMRLVGRTTEAEAMYREGIASYRRALGDADPGVAHGLGNLAQLLGEQGRHQEAEGLLREIIALRAARFGTRSPDYADALDGLSSELALQGRYEEALALRKQGLTIWRAAFGENHTTVAGSLGHISELHQDLGRLDEAEQAAREALEIRTSLFGPDQTLTALSCLRLAEVLMAGGRFAEAETVAARGYQIITSRQGPGHRDSRLANEVMARIYEAQGRSGEAERYRRLARGT
jgi:eukaryotic-like serine/threonine-protein kinase